MAIIYGGVRVLTRDEERALNRTAGTFAALFIIAFGFLGLAVLTYYLMLPPSP